MVREVPGGTIPHGGVLLHGPVPRMAAAWSGKVEIGQNGVNRASGPQSAIALRTTRLTSALESGSGLESAL